MATDFLYFPTKTVAWKKAKLDDILEQLATGKIATASGAGDVNGQFQIQTSLGETKRRLIWDLSKEDNTRDWAAYLETRQTRMVFADRFA